MKPDIDFDELMKRAGEALGLRALPKPEKPFEGTEEERKEICLKIQEDAIAACAPAIKAGFDKLFGKSE